MKVGDPVTLTLLVEHDPAGGLLKPALESTAAWDVRGVEVKAVQPGVSQLRVELAPFETGEAMALPAFEVLVQTSAGVEKLSFEPPSVAVESVLRGEDDSQLSPPKAPLAIPYEVPWRLAGAVLAGLAALALLAWWIRRRVRGDDAAAETSVPAEPPYEEAARALRALEAERLLERGESLAYHDRLSFVLRRYVERRFGAPFLERTTEEALQLARLHDALRPRREALRRVLALADVAKFARAAPAMEDGFRAFGDVRDFVERTKPAPPDAESSAPKEPSA